MQVLFLPISIVAAVVLWYANACADGTRRLGDEYPQKVQAKVWVGQRVYNAVQGSDSH